jgi:hypothetical protein
MSSEPVVVDKSFIQGHKPEAMREFAAQHRILMTEALLFELLSNPQDRRACFAKLPSDDNPVDIVLHRGAFLRKEISTRREVPRPSKKVEKLRFKFNERLLEKDYCLPPKAQAVLAEQHREVVEDAKSTKSRALLMPSFFPDLAARKSHTRRAAREVAEKLIVQPESLMQFYAGLRAPKGQRKLPPRRIISENWAVYRWLQIDFLFCVDLYYRFGSKLNEPLLPKVEQGIQHDILDAQYLLVGVLEGSFATQEAKLQRWFKAILPEGNLYAKDA